ncbi:MAG: Trk family potassium uptake protein [Dehalococcoidia bacterium]|nr:Trk family potassium uptake protein [Dehalococcoidia bacterium]
MRDVGPSAVQRVHERHPSRRTSPPLILFYGFSWLIVTGGVLLLLPISNASEEGCTPIANAFFTATSAVTVTGHTVVNTADYWTTFGHAVIFTLMLVGGLGFTTIATFLLIIVGQHITLPERMLMRDTMGVDRMGGLAAVLRNIVLIVLAVYAIGTATIWWRIHQDFSLGESIWQSAFLSVSGLNNAGFSILPDASSIENYMADSVLLGFVGCLIILGGIGWTVLVDVFRQHRFSRFTLDTKMVLSVSLLLWVMGALVFFLAEYDNKDTLGPLSVLQKLAQSVFHSVSGRTAGLTALDMGTSTELTRLFYPFLMFVGGAAGSVAGGVKVATVAVIIAATISSVRGRLQTEAFGREIPHFQVHRALTVVALAMTFIFILALVMMLTEENIPFLNLFFDTISAFGTTGLSTGVPPQLSLAGKILFMIAMFVGRLGPLTMALALVPREEATVYRFVQERVKIG